MDSHPIVIGGVAFSPWLVLPTVYAALVVVCWTLKKLAFSFLRRLTSHTETKIDDLVLNAVSWPVTVMVFVWSLTATLHFFSGSVPGTWAAYALTGSKAATLLALIIFIDRLAIGVFRLSADRYDALRSTQAFGGVLVHAVVFSMGGLMLLDSMGVSITPIIASLGIGSLAVALALQPTLENVFAGFQILVDKPIRTGNYIKLESGEEGFVHQISWRTTWVRQGLNNMIIIPNKLLINARVLNYDYPAPEMIHIVSLGVSYGSDLEKVERVTVEVARDIQKRVPGAVPEHVPVIRYNKFDASSINFVVVLKIKTFMDNGLVTHEFIKALTARYARENIVIPYPIVAVNTDQERARLSTVGNGDRS